MNGPRYMLLSALAFAAMGGLVKLAGGLGTVSYTHLTLPTNREV